MKENAHPLTGPGGPCFERHRHSSCLREYPECYYLCVLPGSGGQRESLSSPCCALMDPLVPSVKYWGCGRVSHSSCNCVALSFLDCLKLFFKMSFTVSDFYHWGRRDAIHPLAGTQWPSYRLMLLAWEPWNVLCLGKGYGCSMSTRRAGFP